MKGFISFCLHLLHSAYSYSKFYIVVASKECGLSLRFWTVVLCQSECVGVSIGTPLQPPIYYS